ncbi:MAG: pyruvate dehydrogenase complex dihydrolipoamide acetyltransferase [Alphaproteobacteria bacterium]|nr:pyruvate dehydrogenase complex dihydrolipoamide acetyltransferase [Alphaproteobacteria bacterium]
MPIEILMPALSPTMTEGNLVKWIKREGDVVKSGDVIAEIETDKATMEVDTPDEGRMGKILVPEGTEGVPVNQVIAYLLENGEDSSALENMKTVAAPEKAKTPEGIQPAPSKPDLKVVPTHAEPSGDRVFATPLARRLAETGGVNVQSLSGSGPHGRVVKADVEQALSQSGSTPVLRAAQPSSLLSGYEPTYDILPVSNMRKVIARRLMEAKQTVPHFYLTVECDIGALLKAREQINEQANGAYKLSVNDFIIKVCAQTLKLVPEANASWINDQIYQYKSADVAVAVAIDGGLITPVIRQAETKGLKDISLEMKALAARAREGKLRPEEFQGGTFSLSNLGMYGITQFSAIINPPQGCILAVGGGEERPVVRGGKLTTAMMMTCTLSVDHRVVDGAVGANFLKVFKELIENPVRMIL